MEFTCRTKTLQSLTKDILKGKIALTHKLQRKEGQWNRRQQSELIDSLLRGYPINPTYGVKDEGVTCIIDGVQRLSTVRDYLGNKFPLSKDLEPVIINDMEKIIAGKRFKKLDDDTKDALIASELQLYELTNYTEKDVREMFRRQNNGKPLTSSQKRTSITNNDLEEVIFSLTPHPFFNKVFTRAQRKNGSDRDIVLEVLMLTELSDSYDFGSFRTKDINNFIKYYNNNINEDKVEMVRQSLDRLDASFETIKPNKTSLPMIIYGMYYILQENKSVEKYVEWIRSFLATYENNTEYLAFCQSGTSSSENVKGRLNYFKNAIVNM